MTQRSDLDDDTLPDMPIGHHASALPGSIVEPLKVVASGAATSSGLMRESNQDRHLCQYATFAVADGMGGLTGGSEASEHAMESASRRTSDLAVGAPLSDWEELIRSVNRDVRTRVNQLGLSKAGSTLTMVSVEADRVVASHVGDSRLYEYEPGVGTLRQRTVDHNLRSELEALGEPLTMTTERDLPLNGLVSYIGLPDEELRVDVSSWSPVTGTVLLLCSDGVHSYVSAAEIASVMAEFPAAEAASELTRRADDAGGRDNATAVIVELSR